jgi:hypothetical protein
MCAQLGVVAYSRDSHAALIRRHTVPLCVVAHSLDCLCLMCHLVWRSSLGVVWVCVRWFRSLLGVMSRHTTTISRFSLSL